MSLRRILGIALGVLAILSGVSSVALVLISSLLRHTHDLSAAAVARQQMTEDCQRDLLIRERAIRITLRFGLADDVVDRLERIRSTAADADERAAAENALTRVKGAVGVAPTSEAMSDAHEALAALERIERAKVDAATTRARGLDDAASVIGIVVGVLVFGGTLILLGWFNRRVVHPLLRVARSIRDYGRGDTRARAAEEGPREIRRMAHAFNATADRVEEQRAAHSTFLAGVAHELRNPIQVLTTAVEIDLDALGGASPPVERLLGIIKRQLGRLEKLVADLLDTANLEAGRLRLRLAPTDVREIVHSVAALFRSASDRHPLAVEVPDRAVFAECDAQRIEQVVVNLASNAIKYSPKGGTVRLAVTTTRDRVVISVADEGVGMSEEQVAGIFRPFARAGVLRDSVPGHGLGLFVADRIVREHGGSIRVESAPARGSTFRVELPLRAAGATPELDRAASTTEHD